MTITTVGIDLAKNVFAVHCCQRRVKSGSSATWVEPFRPEDSSPVASVTRTQHARTSAASAFSGG